ncbi:MAG: tRNA pseudouridine(55) synthase TruB [Peptostreptococcaceae bacterium]|nr:tRNA pseudouridine(55) synthase TruB [Peptostreptococcaceae bacterium]
MNGILNILKPTGMTSHDVVAMIRRRFSIKKAGHTGTLDPNAAGVLPICVGKATKLSQYIMEKDKSYRVEMIFGKATDSLDSYGNVISEEEASLAPKVISAEDLWPFIGEIEQIPPLYSAVKVGGVKLYQSARRGKEVQEIPSRRVRIDRIDILDYHYPKLRMDVHCSKGTYIRSLVRDIGTHFGHLTYMSLLIRTRSGQFTLADAVSFDELEKDGVEAHLIPMREIEFSMEDHIIRSTAEKAYLNGCKISAKGAVTKIAPPCRKVRVFSQSGVFYGIGEILSEEEGCFLKSDTLLI